MYRQLYQMGGIGSLPMDYGQSLQVPQQMQPSFSSAQNITMNPLLNYGQTPLTMASGGIANLVEREKYGIGSKLKKFVRNIIPNEVAEIAVKAAPFVAPFNPLLAAGMAGIGGFDQTGRIGSSLKSAALTYGAGQIARGIGGAGFQEGFNPFAGFDSSASFGGLGSLFSSPMGNLPFGSFSTPTQLDLTGAGTDYGINEGLRTTTTTGTGNVVQNLDVSGAGTDYGDTLGARTTSNVPFVPKEPGYMDLIKKAGSFENVPLSERFNAVKDLSSKALTDLFTKPIPGQPGKTQLDKTAVFAVISGASSYYEALQLAKKAGIPEGEFSEADYQRLKVDPEKSKFTSLKPENFGIRPTVAGGGLMNEGVLSIKLTPAQAMAMGGRMGYQMGGSGLFTPTGAPLLSGVPQSVSSGILNIQNPLDVARGYATSDPVISALTGNIFTSGQRFRDVFNPRDMTFTIQQAQAAGYSQPEIEELKRLETIYPGFEHNLAEIGLGQTDPQQFATDFANSIRTGTDREFFEKMFPPAQQESAQQQTQQQPIQQQTQQPQMSYNEMQKADYARRMGALEDKFARQGTSATQYIQDMTNLLAQMKTSGGVDPLGAMQSKYYTGPGGGSVSEGSPRGIDARFIINRAQKAEQDAAARVTPKKANGGRINYSIGNEIPVRQNQGGITELDLRAKGGYIPVGIKEKADDVPAMLSRNEFVFTADAVRGAGNGSINKGAQKMYKLMKSLEKKIKKVA